MEFKGTKGWRLQEDGTIIDENYNIVADFMVSDLIDLANAKVAEKALEMIEILQWFVENFEGVFHEGTETDNKVNEAKQLIKQATEL